MSRIPRNHGTIVVRLTVALAAMVVTLYGSVGSQSHSSGIAVAVVATDAPQPDADTSDGPPWG